MTDTEHEHHPSLGIDQQLALRIATRLHGQTTGTIAGMLASNTAGRLPNAEAAMGPAATRDNVPQWRMTETNSHFGGGNAGVSDTDAAALWSLDYLDGVAAHGGAGVNFHGGGAAAYSPRPRAPHASTY